MTESPTRRPPEFLTRLGLLDPARAHARFTFLAWLVMLALLVRQVVVFGTVTPFNDDWIMMANLRQDAEFHAPWLWWVHNEHRIPLAKLVYLASVGWTSDIRGGTFGTVLLLAAVSWSCIRMARRLRGRAHFTDAFFAFLWMNGAQSENVLNSFQVAFAIPAAVTTVGLVVVAMGDDRPGVGRVASLVLLALALPLTGGIGLPQTPAWIAWFVIVFFAARRSKVRSERWVGRLALCSAACVALLTAWYFVDYAFLPGFRAPSPALLGETALQFLTRGVGETAVTYRGLAWPTFLVLFAWSVWLLIRSARDSDTSSARALGIATVMVAMSCTALALGYGRAMDGDGAGLLERYGMVAAPMGCALFAAAALAWQRRSAKVLAFVLFAIAVASVVPNFRAGEREGEARVEKAHSFEADVARGATMGELAAAHWRRLYYSEEGFLSVLHDIEAARLGPFRTKSMAQPRARAFDMLLTDPTEVLSPDSFQVRKQDGDKVLLVRSGIDLCYRLGDAPARIRGAFGLHSELASIGKTVQARFAIELVAASGTRQTLFERTLDAAKPRADRGAQAFDIELGPHSARGEVRCSVTIQSDPPLAWGGWWTGIEVR